MTPAPRTVIVFGIRGSFRIVLLSKTLSASNGTSAGRFGLEPVAMTTTSPRTDPFLLPSFPSTAIVCGSRKRPWPRKISIR